MSTKTPTDQLLWANKRKSFGNATSNLETTISDILMEIPFFLWLYNTGNLLCTVQPSNILTAHVPASPPSQWACQSPVLPARIWHAVKRDLEIRAAAQLYLLITDLWDSMTKCEQWCLTSHMLSHARNVWRVEQNDIKRNNVQHTFLSMLVKWHGFGSSVWCTKKSILYVFYFEEIH